MKKTSKKKISKKTKIGDRDLVLETGLMAGQADGAVLARYGETVVLATVVSSKPREDLGYFPLFVEYVERLYAGGRIKGSRWVKREGRPSDEAILAGRAVDRSIRPLFPKGFSKEVQVVITVLSVDGENDPAVLSIIAASAALSISKIPWNGPIGAVRVGLKDGQTFVNPVTSELEFSDLDLVVSASQKACIMLEAGAKFVPEDQILQAIAFAQEETRSIIKLINDLAKEVGVKKEEFVPKEADPGLKKEIAKIIGDGLSSLAKRLAAKDLGEEELEELIAGVADHLPEEKRSQIGLALEEIFREEVRQNLLAKKRADGRGLDEVREIDIEIGVLPRTHGSAIFRRGETQVLTVTTLGSPSLEQLIESAVGEETKRFIYHYSMPPYSVGETGRFGYPSRRETGHGALAEKALEPVIPSEEKFPYTIRLVSEVLSSNGSTSMASACAGTLSLMDAGVPIAEPVAGVAMGLVGEEKKQVLITDITGAEDGFGDIDFKIAGTEDGITAMQLDVKNEGLEPEILKETVAQARKARLEILKEMKKAIPAPRLKLSQYAPKIKVLHVPVEKIGEVIGPGGRTIRKLIEETKASIDVDDDGAINISGMDKESVEKAAEMIESLTAEVEVGEEYEGEVKRIQPFGAFVEVLPGKQGLVHVSRMSPTFVKDPSKIVSIGQKVKVRVTEIDELGRINLSMLSREEEERQREKRQLARPAGGPVKKGPRRPRQKFRPRLSSRRPRW